MAAITPKRFGFALLVWTVCNLFIFLKQCVNASCASGEGTVYSFILGLLTLFIFFRPSKG
jgi:hypothetical protein